jgi:DNA polymerase-1
VYLPKEDRSTFETSTELSDEQMFYACCDVIALHNVYYEQIREMDEESNTIWKIEREFLWVLLDAPGIRLDVEAWRKQAIHNQELSDKVRSSLPFNPRSSVQVLAFFKSKYKLNLDSSDEATLSSLDFEKYPEAKQILDSRHGSTSASKYGLNFLNYVESDGRIYSSAKQIGAETGRESYTNPPIQTIPGEKEKRRCFIASDGHVMIVADYSAQEPRISAEITQDLNFIETFKQKIDIYIAIGFEVFGERFEKSDERRNFIKALFLAISYGMTAPGLARKLGITEEDAQELLDKFFAKFPDVEDYIKAQNRVGEICSTIYGRKFWLNHYNNQWYRNALNFPIQGSAADCTKLACSRIRKILGYNPIVAIVHDEIVFDVPEDDVERAKKVIKTTMIYTAEEMHPSVPSSIELYVGADWSIKK